MIREFFNYLKENKLNERYIHKQLRKLKEDNSLITGYTVDYNPHRDAYDIMVNFGHKVKAGLNYI